MPSERVQRQVDRLLDEAEAALADRDWARVRTLAEDALALDPDNADARGLLQGAERRLASDNALPAAAAAATPPTPAAQPTSFANGRYVVSKFLGEGGKKRVYLARDSLLDRDVALALIKTEGLDDAARQCHVCRDERGDIVRLPCCQPARSDGQHGCAQPGHRAQTKILRRLIGIGQVHCHQSTTADGSLKVGRIGHQARRVDFLTVVIARDVPIDRAGGQAHLEVHPLAQGETVVPFTDLPATPINTTPAADRRIIDITKINSVFTPRDQWFTTQHYGHPDVDPVAYRLKVGGLVERPLSLSLDDLKKMESRDLVFGFECSGNRRPFQGLSSNGRWTGVPLKTVMQEATRLYLEKAK